MNILIIGGSRFAGPYLISKLLDRGYKVAVFNRGLLQKEYPPQVRFFQGDRNQGFNIKDSFDVVIDMCAGNGWQTKLAIAELNFDFFLHLSSAAVYKKSEIFPLNENSPLGDWPLWGEYNKGKVECEQVLKKSGIKYASIRPVYILGPKNYCDRERFIYSRIWRNDPLVLPGNGQALIQPVSVGDVAESLVLLAEKRIGGAFNCAGDEVITLRGLVCEMAKIAGKKAVIEYNHRADGENFNIREFPFANENLFCANDKLKNIGMKFVTTIYMLQRDYDNYYKNVL